MMICGTIIHGDGVGKAIGHPTANLDISSSDIELAPAVYAAYATLHNTRYEAALVIMQDPWKVEVHLIDYTGEDIYGEELVVDVLEKVSEIEELETIEKLKEKIESDITKIKQICTS